MNSMSCSPLKNKEKISTSFGKFSTSSTSIKRSSVYYTPMNNSISQGIQGTNKQLVKGLTTSPRSKLINLKITCADNKKWQVIVIL